MMRGSIELSIQYDDMSGHITLEERGEKNERGHYTSTALADTSKDDWLILSLNLDGREGVRISLSAADVENEETHRAFHTELTVHLNWNDVRELRDFADMAIKFREPA